MTVCFLQDCCFLGVDVELEHTEVGRTPKGGSQLR